MELMRDLYKAIMEYCKTEFHNGFVYADRLAVLV